MYEIGGELMELEKEENNYLNENLFVTRINKKTGIVSVNRTCKKCKNKWLILKDKKTAFYVSYWFMLS